MPKKDDKKLYMYACSLSSEHHMSAHKKLGDLDHILTGYHKVEGDKFCHKHANHTVLSSHKAYYI